MPQRPHAHVTRREVVLTALAALPVIGCGSREAAGDSRGESRPGHLAAGSTTDLRADTWTERKIELVPGGGDDAREAVFVRMDGGAVTALSARCTCRPKEGSCPVRWIESTRRFLCTCHGGIYDEHGRVVGGPPKKPLGSRPATVENETVYIGFAQR